MMYCNKEDTTKVRVIAEEMIEKDDFPKGSFELSPASLTTSLLGMYASSTDQRAIKISWSL